MVHKKFINKDGKKFGPYLYENYRDHGITRTRYLGKSEKKLRVNKIFIYSFIVFGVILLLLLGYIFEQKGFTGRVSIDVSPVYKSGEKIYGEISLNLKKGELIPKNSLIKVSLNNEEKYYTLSELILDFQFVNGSFYAEDSGLSGNGEGLGFFGIKSIIYPNISFELAIAKGNENLGSEESDSLTTSENGSEALQTSNETKSSEDNANDKVNPTENSTKDNSNNEKSESSSQNNQPETNSNQQTPQNLDNSQITNPFESSTASDGSTTFSSTNSADLQTPTGQSIKTNFDIINGQVSARGDFLYNVENGNQAEIVEGSVKTQDGEPMDSSALNLEVSEGTLKVTTSYSEKDEGFGADYVNDSEIESLKIDLGKFNLAAEKGSLKVSLVYGDVIIASTSIQIRTNNETETNLTSENANEGIIVQNKTPIETKRAKIVIGRPVKWVKQVNVSALNSDNLTLEIPEDAENISIKIGDEARQSVQDVESDAVAVDNTEKTDLINGIISGKVSLTLNLEKKGVLIRFFDWISEKLDFTGNVVSGSEIDNSIVQTSDSQLVLLNGISNISPELSVEYYTAAPTADETNLSLDGKDKKIVISAPSELNYTDVLAYTLIDDGIISAKNSNKIKVYWHANADDYNKYIKEKQLVQENQPNQQALIINNLEQANNEVGNNLSSNKSINDITNNTNGSNNSQNNNINNTTSLITGNVVLEGEAFIENQSQDKFIKTEIPFDFYDLNNDGYIDYIEWNVQHLSNQTYEIIIEITSAKELDSNRTLIRDIYEHVKAKDDNWTLIQSGNYVRVTFEKPLDKTKDITIYARANSSSNQSSDIGVYEINKNESIAKFENILSENYYKVYLTNLNGTQDSFDLLIKGNIEFDYIVDPTLVVSVGNISIPGLYNLSNVRQSFGDGSIALNNSNEGNFFNIKPADLGLYNWTITSTTINSTRDFSIDKDVVGFWRFEEGSGVTAQDESDYNNDGTLTSGAFYNSSSHNGLWSAGFDGINDYINLSTKNNFNFTKGKTIIVWFKAFQSRSNYRAIITQENTGAYWQLLLDITTGNLYVDDNSNAVPFTSSSAYDDNNWHFVALVTDTNINRTRLYADGIELINKTFTSITGTGHNPIWIGASNYVGGVNYLFNGSIDSVIILNKSLSASEVADMYNATKTNYIQSYATANVSLIRVSAGNASDNYAPDYNLTYLRELGIVVFYPMDNSTQSGNTTQINDLAGGFSGILKNGAQCGNISGFIDKGCLFNGINNYVNTSLTSINITQAMWKKNVSDSSWSFILNNSGQAYLDGVITTNGSFTIPLNISDGFVHIGEMSTKMSNGSIDNVMLFNRSLTQAEITTLYQTSALKYSDWVSPTSQPSGRFVQYKINMTSALPSGANLTSEWVNNVSSLAISYNESVAPAISFLEPTPNQSINLNVSAFTINISANDTNEDSITFKLYNSTGQVNTSIFTDRRRSIIYTSLSDAVYSFNVTINDTSGNTNSTETRQITLDATYPLISFVEPTPNNSVNWNSSVVNINISSSDGSNLANYSVIMDWNNSLVAWWRMDDRNASGDPVDYKGINNGSAQNGSTYTTSGKLGEGFSFDGIDDKISINDSNSLDVNATYTISLWAKHTTTSIGDNCEAMITKWSSSDNQKSFFLDFCNDEKFRFGKSGIVNGWAFVGTSSVVLNDINWHHYTATFGGSIVTLYVDGINQSLGTPFSPNGLYENNTQNTRSPVWIGANSASGGIQFWNGSIDDVMIFSRALGADEILSLYNATAYSHNFTSLSDGSYTMKAYAQDIAANVNSTETRTITLDATMPSLIIGKNATQVEYALGSININWSVEDTNRQTAVFNITYPNNSILFSSTNFNGSVNLSSSANLSLLGVYTINLWANDSAGNTNSSLTTFSVNDTIVPLVSITYPANTTYTINVSALNYSVSDLNLQVCKYSLDIGITNTTITCGTNVTGLTSVEGSNSWSVYANDSIGNINSSSITFFKDSILPLISFGNGTEANGTAFSRNWIYVNVSLTEVNEANITFTLYNQTSQVNVTTLGAGNRTINFTSLTDGIYYYNVSVFDLLNNVNSTETRTITIDAVSAPNITLISPANATSSTTNAYNFTFNASDLNGVANCSLVLDDISVSTIGNATSPLTSDYSVAEKGISISSISVNNHNWSVSCRDSVNNLGNSATWLFTVSAPALATTTTTSGGGGGGGSVASISKETIQINIVPGETKSIGNLASFEKASVSMGVNSVASFETQSSSQGSALHSVSVQSLTENSATIIIQSEPIIVTLKAGGSKQIDLDGDNKSDILVTLTSLKEGKANVEIKPLIQSFNILSLDLNEINLNLGIGESKARSVKVTNIGDGKLSINLGQTGLTGIVSFSEKSFTLQPKESKEMNFLFVASSDLPEGIYTGKISVGGKEILVSMNIRSKELLFDVLIAVPDSQKKIKQGQMLESQVNLIPMGNSPRLDVTANYLIKDFNGKIYSSESDTFLVEGQKSFKKQFSTNNLPTGNYVVALELAYPNGIATSSSHFEIVASLPREIGVLTISLIVLVIVLAILLIFLTIRYKRHKKRFISIRVKRERKR